MFVDKAGSYSYSEDVIDGEDLYYELDKDLESGEIDLKFYEWAAETHSAIDCYDGTCGGKIRVPEMIPNARALLE